MGSFTKLNYHVVFSTKFRKPLITQEVREQVYDYIGGTIRGRNGQLIEIGGVDDHVHMLLTIPPTESVSNFIRDVKSAASKWINESKLTMPEFRWQKGYGAFSVSFSQVEVVVNYIRGQQEHHRKLSFRDEYVLMLKRHDIEFNDRFLFEGEHSG